MPRWSGFLGDTPTKFRLRVGNEQIALPHGVAIIGRDSSCFIAIFDPLISRRHMRFQCDGEQLTLEDLGSRNGTRLNGVTITGPHAARDGDRIGIGSYELVIGIADAEECAAPDTPTGLLSICPECRTAYPIERGACPHCGLTRTAPPPNHTRGDDTTLGRWSLGMLVEMLGKVMLTKRAVEAERLMQQAATIVNAKLREQRAVDSEELRALSEVASWLDKANQNSDWRDWIRSIEALHVPGAASGERRQQP